jgi:hypothetical protein
MAAATNRLALPQARRIDLRSHVQPENANIPNLQTIRELRIEAGTLETCYGPNAYSAFLREHHRRPDPEQAAAVAHSLGIRVKASDGSTQPPLTSADRAALKDRKSQREAFRQRFDRIAGLRTAIGTLAANTGDPATLFGDEICLLDIPEMVLELDAAVCFLNRFAEYWHDRQTAAGTPDNNRFCGD